MAQLCLEKFVIDIKRAAKCFLAEKKYLCQNQVLDENYALIPTEKPLVPTEKPLVPAQKPLVPTQKPPVPSQKPPVPDLKSTQRKENKRKGNENKENENKIIGGGGDARAREETPNSFSDLNNSENQDSATAEESPDYSFSAVCDRHHDELLADEDWLASVVRLSGKGIIVVTLLPDLFERFEQHIISVGEPGSIYRIGDYKRRFMGWWRFNKYRTVAQMQSKNEDRNAGQYKNSSARSQADKERFEEECTRQALEQLKNKRR